MAKEPSKLQKLASSAEESSRAVREEIAKNQTALSEGVDRLRAKAAALMAPRRRRTDDLPLSALKAGR